MAEGGYSDDGADACIDCHENSNVLGIMDTKHFDGDDANTPAADKQCQNCHGPSLKHMEFPMQVANLHFGKGSKLAPKTQNAQCLECHGDDDDRSDWNATAHGSEDVVCSECHSIHQPAEVVPSEANMVATCSTSGCHDALMAGKDASSFTHPVGMKMHDESAMTCATCHNPHGPLNSLRCQDCHEAALSPAEMAKQSEKARRFHETAVKKKTDCIRCHKGLAHPIPPLEAARAAEAAEAASAAE